MIKQHEQTTFSKISTTDQETRAALSDQGGAAAARASSGARGNVLASARSPRGNRRVARNPSGAGSRSGKLLHDVQSQACRKYHLKICTNVACCLRGADELVEHCEKKWDIKCGETTKDKKFTLSEEECLGACGTAPAMMLNDDYHENLDVKKLDQLLDTLK